MLLLDAFLVGTPRTLPSSPVVREQKNRSSSLSGAMLKKKGVEKKEWIDRNVKKNEREREKVGEGSRSTTRDPHARWKGNREGVDESSRHSRAFPVTSKGFIIRRNGLSTFGLASVKSETSHHFLEAHLSVTQDSKEKSAGDCALAEHWEVRVCV
ncbi:hypothetical protein TNIN_415991 [Trichonephila inaurata madagascariensis]|uniref:Uncharacterized protein n=1 Tax=Trichonephila inaurata madagascariensis TaxID=2747483 RepID=A0A8X7CIT1_9ARAC|nr:hypothetical protein TNIN_415991 [Trichonephila inaurata madagascariensis]